MKATGKPQFLVYDTLDDRREIHTLLSKLHPRVAVRWLDNLCRKATIHGTRPGPSRAMWGRVELAERRGGDAATRLVNEIYGDVWMLCSQHGLDIDDAIRQLESLTRRQGRGG